MEKLKVEYKYDGLVLTCDPATIERIHALLRAEFFGAVQVPERAVVRHVTVRADGPAAAIQVRWLIVIPFVFVMLFSAVVTISGLLVVGEWLKRHLF